MYFVSTRNPELKKTFRQACLQGQADDGGLYVPVAFPTLPQASSPMTLAQAAGMVLEHFLARELKAHDCHEMAKRALNFEAPLKELSRGPQLLELFHGPTNAFKDVGARCMAQFFLHFKARGTILVATSGDTGGAVAAAFHKLPNLRVVVLFPAKGVSALQEKQLCCWGDNVLSLKVNGDFDDCQRLVKECFSDHELSGELELTSANSINIARLLPQMSYYVQSSHQYFLRTGRQLHFYIPTGNMGNAMAAIWARQCGAPIAGIHIATNANPTLWNFFTQGTFAPVKSQRTLANAMDVGLPSNLERFRSGALDRQGITVQKVSDEDIRKTLVQVYQDLGEMICPHTACAFRMYLDRPQTDAAIVATAHPAKFGDVIAPILGRAPTMPPELDELCRRPQHVREVSANKSALVALIKEHYGAK